MTTFDEIKCIPVIPLVFGLTRQKVDARPDADQEEGA
jgi:hypothetical protein